MRELEHSAGIIFKKDNSILLGRVTNSATPPVDTTGVWDLPKGHIEENETAIVAAVRECYEETGIIVKESQLKDLGVIFYNNKKDLHLFEFIGNIFPEPNKCQCTAYHTASDGSKFLEQDMHKYVKFNALVTHVRPHLYNLFNYLYQDEIHSYK